VNLTSALKRKFADLTPRKQAAVTAYREALNRRADWMDAVCAVVDAVDLDGDRLALAERRVSDLSDFIHEHDLVPPEDAAEQPIWVAT